MASQLDPNDIAALNTLPDAEKADFQRWLVQENTKMELQDRKSSRSASDSYIFSRFRSLTCLC